MSRSVEEWIGKDDDARPPPRVRLRVFERYKGICQLSGIPIRSGDVWEADHKVALVNGGENRETNLWPVLKGKHKEKTARDVAEKAVVQRKRSKHLGIKKRSSRPFPGSRDSPYKRLMDGRVVKR